MNKNIKWFLVAVIVGGGIFLFMKLNQKQAPTLSTAVPSLLSSLFSGLLSSTKSNNSSTPSGMDPTQLAIWNGD